MPTTRREYGCKPITIALTPSFLKNGRRNLIRRGSYVSIVKKNLIKSQFYMVLIQMMKN